MGTGDRPPDERRQHQRGDVVATATLFSATSLHGTYLVENVSASGALLIGDVDLPRGTLLTILLQLPGKSGFSLAGRLVRRMPRGDEGPRLALTFVDPTPEDEDALHQAIVDALEHGAATVLIIGQDERTRVALDEDLRALGHRPAAVATPLEALALLGRDESRVSTVVVDLSSTPASGVEVLGFIAEAHPNLRRIAIVPATGGDDPRADLTLRRPWTRAALAEAFPGQQP